MSTNSQRIYVAYLILLVSSKSIHFTSGGASRATKAEEEKCNSFHHPRNTQDGYLRLQVLSSSDRIHVYLDSKEVLCFETKNKNNSNTLDPDANNGLHLVAMNPKSGFVVLKRRFMTEVFAEDIGIPVVLQTLKSGEIVVLAVKYDASLNLARNIRKLFLELGAFKTPYLNYRAYFVWVYVTGGKTLVEAIIRDDPTVIGNYCSSPIHTDLLIPRDIEQDCWNTSANHRNIKRAEFCYNYGGYGQLCDCDSPLNLNFNTPELKGNLIRNVPILVIASNRPQSLFKCLLTILQQPGGHKDNIIVVIDGDHTEVNKLLDLLEIRYFIHLPSKQISESGGRIAYHYKYSLNLTLQVFPKSEFLIVLEEDLLVAPDFVSYFSQTANILASDNSLYCVNAWNDLSAMHTGGNPHHVMRQETQPAYGWMIKTELFKEIVNIWPTQTKKFDWDMWFRGPFVKSSRECLAPEISRSFHLGESGAHIKGQFTFAHLTGHLMTFHEHVQLQNLERLKQADYEEDLYELFSSDRVVYLNTSLHPCDPHFIPRNFTDKTVIIFFWMESILDNTGWHRLSSCLGVFNMDTRNGHRGMFRFYFYNTRIFALGYPFSDYSLFKPGFVTPVSEFKSEWDEENLHPLTMMNRIRFRVPDMERHIPFRLSKEKASPMPFFKYVQVTKAG